MLSQYLRHKILLCMIGTGLWAHPKLCNLPPHNDHFFKRSCLERLVRYYTHRRLAKATIAGVSGSGKSQVAKALAYARYQHYTIIWWFDASRDLASQFHDLATSWYAHEHKALIPPKKLTLRALKEHMRCKLRQTQDSWLLIFDHVQRYQDIAEYLPLVHPQDTSCKHIVITSQNQKGWPQAFPITIFDAQEALAYVQTQMPEEPAVVLQSLVDTVGTSPFYLARAIGYMKNRDIPVKSYIAIYTRKKQDLTHEESVFASKEDPLPEVKRQDHERALHLSLDDVQTHHPHAYRLLSFICFMDTAVSHNMIEKLSDRQGANAYSCISALAQLSLLEHRIIEGTKAYTVHNIEKAIVTQRMSWKQCLSILHDGLSLYSQALDSRWEHLVTFTDKNPSIPLNAMGVWNKAVQNTVYTQDMMRLGEILMRYHLYKTHDYQAFEAMIEPMERALSYLTPPQDVWCDYMINTVYDRRLYQNHTGQSKTEETRLLLTEQRLVKAIDFLRTQSSTSSHRYADDVLVRGLYTQAHFYLFQGKLSQAESCLAQGDSLLNQIHSQTNKNMFLFIKALVLKARGECAGSHAILQSLDIKKERNQALKLSIRTLQAWNLACLGRTQTAKTMCNAIVLDAKKFYHTQLTEHTAQAHMVYALALLEERKPHPAKTYLDQAWEASILYFGGYKHPDQAQLQRLLGHAYCMQGDCANALKCFEKAYDFCRTHYQQHRAMDGVGELYARFVQLALLMGDEERVRQYAHKHRNSFGDDHPRTIRIFLDIDKALEHKDGT